MVYWKGQRSSTENVHILIQKHPEMSQKICVSYSEPEIHDNKISSYAGIEPMLKGCKGIPAVNFVARHSSLRAMQIALYLFTTANVGNCSTNQMYGVQSLTYQEGRCLLLPTGFLQ